MFTTRKPKVSDSDTFTKTKDHFVDRTDLLKSLFDTSKFERGVPNPGQTEASKTAPSLDQSPLLTDAEWNMKNSIKLAILATSTLIGCQSLSTNEPVYQRSYQYKNADGETVTRTVEVKRDPIYESRPSYDDRWSPSPTPVVKPIALVPETPSSNTTTTTESPEKESDSSSNFLGSLELAMTPGHVHLGAHLGIALSSWLDARLGISGFFSKDTYTGFDLSTRAYVPFEWKVRPYAGLGLYLGDSRTCYRDPLGGGYTVEVCDKKFLSAGYGEVGLELGKFHLFVRDYNITRAGLSVPTETFYGLGVTTRF